MQQTYTMNNGGNNNNQMDGASYDAAGNLLHDPNTGANYTYDAEGRLITAGAYSYIYDAEGRRVAKLSSGTITNEYLFDSSGAHQIELDGSGNVLHTNVFAGGKLLATYQGSQTYFHFSDWLGNRRAEINAQGQTTLTCSNYPFGDGLSCTGSMDPTEHHFTGKERDTETGLDFFGARFYSSNQGRWLVPDWSEKPAGVPYGNFSDPQSLNLYGYVRNSPMSRADADGRCDVCWQIASWIATDIATEGGKQFAKNVGIGAAKGTRAAVFNAIKTTVAAFKGAGNPAAAIPILMTPTPEALQPSNQTQAQVSTATQVALTAATVVASAGVAGASATSEGVATTTVTHFTSDAGAAAIADSGGLLRAGTYVTTPAEIPAGAASSEVESLLEIGPGKGTNSITFDTPSSNLGVPENGSTTSGGAQQFQLKQPTQVDPTTFKKTD